MLCSSLPCLNVIDFYLLSREYQDSKSDNVDSVADSYLHFMKIFALEMVKWLQKVLLNCVLQGILGFCQLLVAFTNLYQ